MSWTLNDINGKKKIKTRKTSLIIITRKDRKVKTRKDKKIKRRNASSIIITIKTSLIIITKEIKEKNDEK